MSINNVSLNQAMRGGEIDGINSLNEVVDKINNIGKLIFEGTWNKGTTLTLPELSDYSLFAVYLQNEGSPALVFSKPNFSSFQGQGGTISSTPNIFTLSVRATRNVNTLTLTTAGVVNVIGTTITEKPIVEIYGII